MASVFSKETNLHFSILDECTSNNDCPLDKACISKKCVDPCQRTSCGDKAVCEVDFHQAHCSCPPGLQGNPIVNCFSVECTDDDDCGTAEKCDFSRQKCYDICQQEPCGSDDAYCEARNHKKSCTCPPPLQGDGNVYCGLKRKLMKLIWITESISKFNHTAEPIETGCLVHSDCNPGLACEKEQCVNPCIVANPCTGSKTCTVSSSRPGDPVVACLCPSGLVSGEYGICEPGMKELKAFWVELMWLSILVTGVPQCTSNSECLDQEVCHQGSCQNACMFKECGSNAKCSATNHQASCDCYSGFSGTPDVECYKSKTTIFTRLLVFLHCSILLVFVTTLPILETGCASNEECPDYAACENRLCINPCAQSDVCANLATCTVYQHKAVCTCPNGYVGTPEIDCRLREYEIMNS